MADVVRIDHVPKLTLSAAGSPNVSVSLGAKRRSGVGLNVNGPIDFGLGMSGKGI
jgi:hypothetical protein